MWERGLDGLLAHLCTPADGGPQIRGTVTPHYMHGWHHATTAIIAARIAARLPVVNLIAVLRDPIERARSQHAMAVARAREERTFEEAVDGLLTEVGLTQARGYADDTNCYVVQGEYGRILGDYLVHFPRESLHVETSVDLESDPDGVLRRISRFLGVEESAETVGRAPRLFTGGSQPRVPPAALPGLSESLAAARPGARAAVVREALDCTGTDHAGTEALVAHLERHVRAPAPLAQTDVAGLRFFITKIWNVVPETRAPLDRETHSRLAEHFATDSARLEAILGRTPPWRRDPGE